MAFSGFEKVHSPFGCYRFCKCSVAMAGSRPEFHLCTACAVIIFSGTRNSFGLTQLNRNIGNLWKTAVGDHFNVFNRVERFVY